jgi:hypothetical protein
MRTTRTERGFRNEERNTNTRQRPQQSRPESRYRTEYDAPYMEEEEYENRYGTPYDENENDYFDEYEDFPEDRRFRGFQNDYETPYMGRHRDEGGQEYGGSRSFHRNNRRSQRETQENTYPGDGSRWTGRGYESLTSEGPNVRAYPEDRFSQEENRNRNRTGKSRNYFENEPGRRGYADMDRGEERERVSRGNNTSYGRNENNDGSGRSRQGFASTGRSAVRENNGQGRASFDHDGNGREHERIRNSGYERDGSGRNERSSTTQRGQTQENEKRSERVSRRGFSSKRKSARRH